MSEPAIRIERDAAAGAERAADLIVALLAEAVRVRGRADWATTGGSSVVGIYSRLLGGSGTDQVPWAKVHVWWGDDRFVPRDHPLSNVKPFDDIILDIGAMEEGTAGGGIHGLPIPFGQIHPFPTGPAIGEGLGAGWCAATLADELRAAGLAEADGWPVFDLVLLGVGRDGHLLSVFPGSPAFDATQLGLAIEAPSHIEPHIERVTLHPGIVETARAIIMVTSGADKASIVAKVFGAERDPRRLPAQLARREGATWILDEAAAAELPR